MYAISLTQFQAHFFNESLRISIQISLKFVLIGPIFNNSALVQVMAPNRRQVITWTSAELVHWLIDVALGWDELTINSFNWHTMF